MVNSGHFQNARIFGILVIFTNVVPMKSSYLLTLSQYLSNIFNGHSEQFLKLSV